MTQDMRDVTGRESIPNLLAASYAASSWKKLNSALNRIKEYTATIGEGGKDLEWPIPCKTLEGYICWAIEKGLKANSRAIRQQSRDHPQTQKHRQQHLHIIQYRQAHQGG
jgi:hypothetical protein